MLFFHLRWWILSKGLEKLSLHPIYKKLIDDRHEVIQFKTLDGKFSRYFKISQGQIQSEVGDHRYATLIVQINDSKYINRLMHQGKNLQPLIKGLQFGEISTRGDISLLFWFFELIYTKPIQSWLKPFNWARTLHFS